MTPADAPRPVLFVLVSALAATLAGCGGAETTGDGRFEQLANHVSGIQIPLGGDGSTIMRGRGEPGQRPAKLEVAVMDTHDFWDARDAQARGAMLNLADYVRPMAESVKQEVSERLDHVPMLRRADEAPQAPQVAPQPQPQIQRTAVGEAQGRTIQLGAFSSEAAAREAWKRLQARVNLASATPIFQTVVVGERTMTRLKVGPVSAEAAPALCRAAQVTDPWCQRAS